MRTRLIPAAVLVAAVFLLSAPLPAAACIGNIVAFVVEGSDAVTELDIGTLNARLGAGGVPLACRARDV